MNMSDTGHRYKDVLFSLGVANQYNQSLGKLQLQKFIYLADTLYPLWEMASTNGYETYKHGPYDPNIQNAVDVLAFRGAVDIIQSEIISRGNTRVSYRISEIGSKILNNILEESAVAKKYELYEMLGHFISQRGWDKLRDLVYSEATYLTAKTDGFGRSLSLNNFISNDSFQILDGFNDLVRDRSSKLNKQSLIAIFFQILDNYQLYEKA